MKKFLIVLCSTVLIAISPTVFAHDGSHDVSAHAHTHKTSWVRGEVIKIDKPRKHITIKHEEIVSIGMDAMTMPFKVKNVALLNKVKVGDPVQFELLAKDDELTLTRMEVVK